MSTALHLEPSIDEDLEGLAASEWAASLYDMDGVDQGDRRFIAPPPSCNIVRLPVHGATTIFGFNVWRDGQLVASTDFPTGPEKFFRKGGEIVINPLVLLIS